SPKPARGDRAPPRGARGRRGRRRRATGEPPRSVAPPARLVGREPGDVGGGRGPDARLRVHAPRLPALRGGPDPRLSGRVALHPGAREHVRNVGGGGSRRPRTAGARRLPLRTPPPARAQLRSADGLLAAPDPGRQPDRGPRLHPGSWLRRRPRPPDPGPRAHRRVRRTDLPGGAAAAAVRDPRGARVSVARWAVFAYHTFGARALEALLARGEPVVAVVTHPDDPGEGDWFESVAETARVHRLPLFAPPSPNLPAVVDALRALAPDVILSAWYRRLLGPDLLALHRVAALHPVPAAPSRRRAGPADVARRARRRHDPRRHPSLSRRVRRRRDRSSLSVGRRGAPGSQERRGPGNAPRDPPRPGDPGRDGGGRALADAGPERGRRRGARRPVGAPTRSAAGHARDGGPV